MASKSGVSGIVGKKPVEAPVVEAPKAEEPKVETKPKKAKKDEEPAVEQVADPVAEVIATDEPAADAE